MRLQLLILRGVFLIFSCGAGYQAGRFLEAEGALPEGLGSALGIIAGVILGGIVIFLDILYKKKAIGTMSAVAFGLVAGMIMAWLVRLLVLPLITPIPMEWYIPIQIMLICFLCYLAISFIMQTKDDFRFAIPYIEFSRERRGPKPIILDTSVVIDGRIADVAEVNILDGAFVIPRFVLQELQHIADSPEKARRSRGRRGLDVLARLQKNSRTEVRMVDPILEGDLGDVDAKLVELAKKMDARLMTNDYNLNKVAQLQGVQVININELANAMRPVVLPGEGIRVKVIRPGEEIGQGVGYLDDGTMVVIEQGRSYIGQEVDVTVTSVLQTSAGKMIFGRLAGARETMGRRS